MERDAWRLAEEVLLERFASRGALDAADVDDLCGAHPEIASEIREMHADWLAARRVLSADAADPGLDARIERILGRDALASVNLHGGAARDGPRYRALGEIGRGGMGRVTRVYDADLRRELAMKSLRSRLRGDARATFQLGRALRRENGGGGSEISG